MKINFDETYFERGIEAGVSLYENFSWQPWRSIPMASRLKEMFPGASILDYGCAKGYLVKALRLLGVDAFGYDISEYAVSQADDIIKLALSNNIEYLPNVDVVFAKDVLEHISPDNIIETTLRTIRQKCKKAFIIVPLGDNGKYRIKQYHHDKTHLIAADEEWWARCFRLSKFKIDKMCHHIEGFKDNWMTHPYGNGFFFLS